MGIPSNERLNRREMLALRGLRLPKATLDALQASGIYCVPAVSIEYQRSAQRYVIRAQESGGAVPDVGAYCGFVSDSGASIPWLQRPDTLSVNGIHARTVTAELVRIQLVRVLHTYDLLITKHTLVSDAGPKPRLANSIVFYGRQGTLELDLWAKDKDLSGSVLPVFVDRGGEQLSFPRQFEQAARHAVAGVSCCGCRHVHLLVPPTSEVPLDE